MDRLVKASSVRALVRNIKRQALTVYCVARHPDTPLPVKLLALSVAAYAFSPIDLIPDFIPVLGFLDDIIIVPLGLALVIRWTPVCVLKQSRQLAGTIDDKPVSYLAGLAIATVWALLLWLTVSWLVTRFSSS